MVNKVFDGACSVVCNYEVFFYITGALLKPCLLLLLIESAPFVTYIYIIKNMYAKAEFGSISTASESFISTTRVCISNATGLAGAFESKLGPWSSNVLVSIFIPVFGLGLKISFFLFYKKKKKPHKICCLRNKKVV